MINCSLAVDIGASSGIVIAGHVKDDKIIYEEVYRFDNQIHYKNGHYCWDIEGVFSEIKNGIKQSIAKGYNPESIGIDTWAVDFVLLDEKDELLTDAVAYRDSRTTGMMEEVFSIISKDKLYAETGIQFQKFNTIYQLYYLKKNHPELLNRAKTFLMIPDYINFLLTGVKASEYTNASTTQLVNAFSKEWDRELLEKLEINQEIFQEILPAGSSLGKLKQKIKEELAFDMEVILPATHDTGSAVVALPENENTIYISSGTWSLIGIESDTPVSDTKALDYNFTNEGGYNYRFRFLKNIMGLWMIQEVKRNFDNQYSFEELTNLAKEDTAFHSVVDVNDNRFLRPENMIEAIQNYCQESSQQVPQTVGEIVKCVLDSLAISYQKAVEEIEEIHGRNYQKINVIGGGSKNEMLNQLVADSTNKEVVAGPVEAAALGNISVQLITLGKLKDLDAARRIISKSFALKRYSNQSIK